MEDPAIVAGTVSGILFIGGKLIEMLGEKIKQIRAEERRADERREEEKHLANEAVRRDKVDRAVKTVPTLETRTASLEQRQSTMEATLTEVVAGLRAADQGNKRIEALIGDVLMEVRK